MVVDRPLARVRRETDPHPRDAPARGARVRRAVGLARQQYPGPIGEWLARELDAFAHLAPQVGGTDALTWRVVEHIIEKGTPDGTASE
jgi:hypothetical protein